MQLNAHRDQGVFEVSEQARSAAHAPWADPMLKAERDQGSGRLADVPFHRVEPVAAIGDMGDAQTFAGGRRLSSLCGSNAPNGI